MCDPSPVYEVFIDGKKLIYRGHDWVASILACQNAGRVHGATRIERWEDGHLYARLVTTPEPIIATKK